MLRKSGKYENVDEIEEAIETWDLAANRRLPYHLGGHATIAPNVAALRICGFAEMANEALQAPLGEEVYVRQIVDTTNSVYTERDSNPPSIVNLIYPRSPDLNIYLPATYDLNTAVSLRSNLEPLVKKNLKTALRLIERQSSYQMTTTTAHQLEVILGVSADQKKDSVGPVLHPFIKMRAQELWLGTEAVGCLAASQISAVVRLPNRMNRTRGIVKQFAQHYRADRPQIKKRREMFRDVQREIGRCFPHEFRPLIERSSDGIRIISDAHIEWLDVDGVPLGLRKNVSRIPVTPGNLFIETLVNHENITSVPDDFFDILVVSGLDSEDVIAKQFTIAFEVFGEQWRERLRIKIVRAKSRKQLIEAINDFEGLLMVFDGHGSHKDDQPGVLWLGTEPVDVWHLRKDIVRAPPIVVLSACDTHAADRNHATVANGFLSLGSRSVLASVFPLHASHAATFVARLLFRISHYVPAAIGMFGRSLTWLEVVSGMLRRQAVTDIFNQLIKSKSIQPVDEMKMLARLHGIADIGLEDPFSHIFQYLSDSGIEKRKLIDQVEIALSSSSTISYVHIGRPETILINSSDNIRNFVKMLK